MKYSVNCKKGHQRGDVSPPAVGWQACGHLRTARSSADVSHPSGSFLFQYFIFHSMGRTEMECMEVEDLFIYPFLFNSR